ncbi:MAG: thiamine pyrophosphate-binding protein [Rhizobiales bacterium]|nr:thiamine pyrophosphate-binding protein [Hyphomicrobiales bacterium]
MEQRRPYTSGNYSGYSSHSPQESYTSPTPSYSSTSYSGMPGSNEMRGADIIAEYLVKEKVPYILGYAGHGAIGLLDGIYKQTDKIRHISPRVEQGAGFMADVYYRLTGNPLAVYASTGPGPMNLMISVANAFYDNSAFFVITGQVPTTQVNSGALQDDYRYNGDMSSIFQPVVKKSYRIRKVDDLCSALPEAFGLMRSGRPGPVHFDMPYNLYIETAPVQTPDPVREAPPSGWTSNGISDYSIQRALELLCAAERPLILAGGGIRLADAYDELKTLAELLDIPVYTSFMGKGALASDHNLHIGIAGVWGDYPATEACRNADVILAIGARFNDLHTGSWIPGYVYNIPPTKLLQVDIDENEIGRNYPVEIGMTGDAKQFLDQAIKIARGRSMRLKSGDSWRQQIQGWQSEWRNFCAPFETSSDVPIEPRRILADMNRLSPPGTIMVDDIGNCQVWSEQYWQTKIPGTHLTSGGFAAMGFGVCGVLGARLARPDSPCVTLCGDGGFMMWPHAVATAVEYNLPAVWVVMNNYAIGTIRDLQRVYLDGRELGTSFVNEQTGQLWNPDFTKMAEAMGARGIRIEHPDQFGDAYAEALTSNVPTVLDVVINRDTGIPVTGTWQMPPIPEVQPTFGQRKIR